MQLPGALQLQVRWPGEANIHGVEPAPRPRHARSHVNTMQKIILDLSANDYGTEMCNLGANCYGAKFRIQKIQRNIQRSKREHLSKKG